jgi:ABC-type glycerol-3-phosphate transport system substrate-binding protein
MKSKRLILVFLVLLALPALACSLPGSSSSSSETFVGGDCDSSTTRVDMNTTTSQSVQAGNYPDACEVYCLWVPENGSRLDIGISNFDVDLDMYVDTDLSVLTYEDHGQWESNAYGTGDESVTISNPGGRYYIQVCSYEGLASSFNLSSTFTK